MSDCKVGIGLCTYNRPDKSLQTAKAIKETTQNVNLICSIDGGDFSKYNIGEFIKLGYEVIIGDNQGVVRNKNRIINCLQNCDFIFIIEDDLTPIKFGWVERYIKALQVTGYEHINYIHELARSQAPQEQEYSDGITIEFHKSLGGALMVVSNKCLQKVGILDSEYKFYGYGHCDYTRRCQQANVYPNLHPHIKGIDDYLKLDIRIQSATESSEKKEYIRRNGIRFQNGSPRIHIPIKEFLR